MSVWRLAWRVSQHDRRTFWFGWGSFVVFFTFPVATGWLLGRGFAALESGDVGRVGAHRSRGPGVRDRCAWPRSTTGRSCGPRHGCTCRRCCAPTCWQRRWRVAAPEAGQPVGSSGEAVTHFRDDAEDVTMFVDGLIDVSAGLVFTVLAGFVLGSTNARRGCRAAAATGRRRAGHSQPRRSDQAVPRGRPRRVGRGQRTAGRRDGCGDDGEGERRAIDPTMARLKVLVDRRRHTAVRDRVLDDGVQAFSQGAADIGLGLVLVASAGALASGRFAVGDLAVFTAYLGWLSFLPRMVGRVLARRKQAGVAFDRMRRPGGRPRRAQHRHRARLAGRPARHPSTSRRRTTGPRAAGAVRGAWPVGPHTPAGAGVHDVDLAFDRGSFVVVTGPVGSGKSTLLRAVLGLAYDAEVTGQVLWNGAVVVDRGAFLVPPNAAFLPQVPQLISDSVGDNITLGPVPTGRAWLGRSNSPRWPRTSTRCPMACTR